MVTKLNAYNNNKNKNLTSLHYPIRITGIVNTVSKIRALNPFPDGYKIAESAK